MPNDPSQQFSDSRFHRETDLVRSPKRPGSGLLPFSHSTLWRMVREGTFPAPMKLGPRITAWRASDVTAWLDKQKGAGQ